MDAEVTSAFRDLRDTLLAEMRTGFAGVYLRQDHTNGRLLEAEKLVERHDERIKTLFRRLPTSSERADGTGDNRRITQRDVLIVIGTVTTTLTIIGSIWKLVPLIQKVLSP